jgi:sugar transferase (PEP-CTERM/EpsH1 system associated)
VIKTPLLFLCHRIPYPPDKGDKIRSYHLLRHLSQHFDIFLATFVDNPDDWQWVPELEKLCVDCRVETLKPSVARLRSLRGFLTDEPLSVPYYISKGMEAWIADRSRSNAIKHLLVYSSAMAQFAEALATSFTRSIVDFVDVDSDKWAQYARRKKWPLSWLYHRESRLLLDYEKRVIEQFETGLFVSASEAAMFRRLAPELAHKVGHYSNGVDATYFRPDPARENPYPAGERVLVFTGAMDYWPNIDAVTWFAREVLPSLKAFDPAVRLYIVGNNPSRSVLDLAAPGAVVVTGRVPDVRPYLQYALAAVAPMRIARGVQNKILEGMAMARPVLASPLGLEGIEAAHEQHVLVAGTCDDYLAYYRRLCAHEFADIGAAARQLVLDQFDWDTNLTEVSMLLLAVDGPSAEDRLRA